MTENPDFLKYTKDHEWVQSLGSGRARVGITYFAQKQLGDIVFVELPKKGDQFENADPFASVESVKSVTEVYMPVAGTIAAVNEALNHSPETVNDDAYGDGWMVEITMTKVSELDGLLTAAEYEGFIRAADE